MTLLIYWLRNSLFEHLACVALPLPRRGETLKWHFTVWYYVYLLMILLPKTGSFWDCFQPCQGHNIFYFYTSHGLKKRYCCNVGAWWLQAACTIFYCLPYVFDFTNQHPTFSGRGNVREPVCYGSPVDRFPITCATGQWVSELMVCVTTCSAHATRKTWL